jgi:choline kinase
MDLSRDVLAGPSGDKAFFEAALQHGIDQNALQVHWIDITGLRWREVDFPEDLVAAERLLGTVVESSD